MKKFGLIALTVALVAAMCTGCRRPMPDTTGTTSGTRVTTPATRPAPQNTTRPAAKDTLPTPSKILPDGTSNPIDDGGMGRGRMGPRF